MKHQTSPEQTEQGRELRRNSTVPERLLWGQLRAGRLRDLKFRRQQPIGPFVVDFYCEQTKLVVEVDGRSHEGRADYDHAREQYLRGQGLRILRVDNDDVIHDMDTVLLGILKACGIELN
jgi:very-short-patch-repair endonuclease